MATSSRSLIQPKATKQEIANAEKIKIHEKYKEALADLELNLKILDRFRKKEPIEKNKEDLEFFENEVKELQIKVAQLLEKYQSMNNYEYGGGIENENAEMVMNNNNQIKHHTEELEKIVTPETEVPAWVVSKVGRSASDLSDATHYLDGVSKIKYADGGSIPNNYEGKAVRHIWNSWSVTQRKHFLLDHNSDEVQDGYGEYRTEYLSEVEIENLAEVNYEDLPQDIKTKVFIHTDMGQYADGGGVGFRNTISRYNKMKELWQTNRESLEEINEYIDENYTGKIEEFIPLIYSVFPTTIKELGLTREDFVSWLSDPYFYQGYFSEDNVGEEDYANGGGVDSLTDNLKIVEIKKAGESRIILDVILDGKVVEMEFEADELIEEAQEYDEDWLYLFVTTEKYNGKEYEITASFLGHPDYNLDFVNVEEEYVREHDTYAKGGGVNFGDGMTSESDGSPYNSIIIKAIQEWNDVADKEDEIGINSKERRIIISHFKNKNNYTIDDVLDWIANDLELDENYADGGGVEEGQIYHIDSYNVKQYEGERVVDDVTILETPIGKTMVLVHSQKLGADVLVPIRELFKKYADGGGVSNILYTDSFELDKEKLAKAKYHIAYNRGIYTVIDNKIKKPITSFPTQASAVNYINKVGKMANGGVAYNPVWAEMEAYSPYSSRSEYENKKEYDDLAFASKSFSKSAEILVKENLMNGEICICKLRKILGHEPSYPVQYVGSIKLTKCFLKPFYKI